MSDTLPALNQRLDALIHALAQEFAQNEHQIGKIQSDVLGLIDDSLATGSAHTWSIDKILLSIKQVMPSIFFSCTSSAMRSCNVFLLHW